MAAEAMGLATRVIAIADVSYKGSKRRYELIDGFRAASETLSDLHTQLPQSLKDTLGSTNDESLSDEMEKRLQDFNLG